MSDCKVISLKSRRDWFAEQADQELDQLRRNEEDTLRESERLAAEAEELTEMQTETVMTLAAVAERVAEGRMEGVIIVARDPVTKAFFTYIGKQVLAPTATDAFAYAGLLDSLRLEVSDASTMAPFLNIDGEICQPATSSMAMQFADFGEEE